MSIAQQAFCCCLAVWLAAAVLSAAPVSAADGLPGIGSVPIPPLPSGTRPNIIFILVDDQGYDDFGLHNPKYLQTPNMDKFLLGGTRFDNFYVAPQCAQTRAMFLTGRHHAKVGTMLTNGGNDFIHHQETTIAEVMKSGGYTTYHFGKWHNADVAGYTPLDVGFNMSWNPRTLNLNKAPNKATGRVKVLYNVNGEYELVTADAERLASDLNNMLLNRLKREEQNLLAASATEQQPFFVYYPMNAIHKVRRYPQNYRKKFFGRKLDPKYANVSANTRDSWAYVEYLDEVLGELFDYLETSAFKNNTYVFLTSDNGPDELADITAEALKLRLPSGMQGFKSRIYEGGVRTMLAVQGPGVQAGVIDSTLLDMTDMLPTIAQLSSSNITTEGANMLSLDGTSFKHLLVPTAALNDTAAAHRGDSLATRQQKARRIFLLSSDCWMPDSVPQLGGDRKVLKPQPLLDFATGGSQQVAVAGNRTGFERCIAVRFSKYKWHGSSGKVYRFIDDDHREIPANEVTGTTGQTIAKSLSGAAKRWWSAVLASPHSFVRSTTFIGLEPYIVTNMNANSAHERTNSSITLSQLGASGFRNIGDYMCWDVQVLRAGTYDMVYFYTSFRTATFKLSIGNITDIRNGSAASITTQLQLQAPTLAGQSAGNITLNHTGTNKTDACLELVHTDSPGKPVFQKFALIRFTLLPGPNMTDPNTNVTDPGGNATDPGANGTYPGSDVTDPGTTATDPRNNKTDPGSNVTDPGTIITNSSTNATTPGSSVANPGLDMTHPSSNLTGPEGNVTPPGGNTTTPWSVNRTNSNSGLVRKITPPGELDVASRFPAVNPLNEVVQPSKQISLGAETVIVSRPAAGLDVHGRYSWLREMLPAPSEVHGMGVASQPDAGNQIRLANGWPQGQSVLQLMFSPFDTEDCPNCNNIKI